MSIVTHYLILSVLLTMELDLHVHVTVFRIHWNPTNLGVSNGLCECASSAFIFASMSSDQFSYASSEHFANYKWRAWLVWQHLYFRGHFLLKVSHRSR